MNIQMPKASRRVRFEEVTPAHEYAAFFSVSIAPLVAHLGLPIFEGYDDLDDLQLAFLTLPSGATVTLGEYAGMPGTSLYIAVAMQSIPQIIFDSCQQLRVSRQEIEWVHADWQVEFERLYAEGKIEGIDRSSIAEFSQSNDLEPIDCFYHALEIYTRPKFPEHWAMLQHNLGLAYFDRSKGEPLENLQESIECFYNSREILTQDQFPEKWQINEEDLDQSIALSEMEKEDLIRDILDRPRVCRNLKYMDLSWSDLSDANLIRANLTRANLIETRLMRANLSGVNLSDADLSGANLSDADLTGAYLCNTDLNDVTLSDATNVYKAQFVGYNYGISEPMRRYLMSRGAIFEDAPSDRSESRTLVPR